MKKESEEGFVPYKFAMLAKQFQFAEKGFGYWISPDKYQTCEFGNHNQSAILHNHKIECLAPTYQRLVQWFREEHQIFIDSQTDCTSYPKYCFEINRFYGNPKDLTEKEWGWEEIKPKEWFLYRNHFEVFEAAFTAAFDYLQNGQEEK